MATIQFLGAAKEVTGSKHLITTDKGKRILLDCGMYQGKGLQTDGLNRDLGFDPKQIDVIILSHAHIDHSGLIPYVWKLGFRGSVVCTNATRDLCAMMLADSGQIQEGDTATFNKKRVQQGLPLVEPLYSRRDAVKSQELFIGVSYNRKFRIDADTTVKFTHTGHLLGGGVVNLEITDDGKPIRIAYTGDIGRPHDKILRRGEPFAQADILITEATYGDRLHVQHQDAEQELLGVIYETCIKKRGKVIIPSFSVGRTQEIVYALNNFYNQGVLPRVPIYVDSPMAVNATEIFRLHPECFNEELLDVMIADPDPFGFDGLNYVRSKSDSVRLNYIDKPCVIISASGMMEAGRVKHHIAHNIGSPYNTILAVGYCAPNTLGAKILRGDKEVSIHGIPYEVRAKIERIESFSGHGDYKEMGDFISCQDAGKLKHLFLVHGEYAAQEAYANYLKTLGFDKITIPDKTETFKL